MTTGAQTTGGHAYQESYDQQVAQFFTTTSSQTSITFIEIQLSTVFGSPITPSINPMTVQIVADSFGTPTGDVLATTSVNSPYVYSSSFWVTIPLSVFNLSSSTTYWIVLSEVGTPSGYYVWQQSDQPNGAMISTDGFSWTEASFGMMYKIFTQSSEGSDQPTIIIEDDGNRITNLTYDGSGNLTEMVVTTLDTAGGSVAYDATFTYTNGLITGAS